MKIDIQLLKDTLTKKGYKWDSDLNLVGIRTTIQAPDVFNDLMCVIWKQKEMPKNLILSCKGTVISFASCNTLALKLSQLISLGMCFCFIKT